MATGSSVIAALRSGASGAPPTSAKSGVGFFDPTTGTTSPIDDVVIDLNQWRRGSTPPALTTFTGVGFLPATTNTKVESTVDALRRNNTYALDNPTMLTMPAGVVGGNKPKPVVKKAATTSTSAAPATASTVPPVPNPFAQGQATNQKFGAAFKEQMGYDMPDMAPYTGVYGQQYASEMSSPQGMANLAQDMTYATGGGGGIYQGDDLVPVIGGAAATGTAGDWWNNNYDAVFGNGNSFFLPDTSEVTFVPREVLGAFRTEGETDDQVSSRLRYGNTFLNAGGDPIRPEYDIRGLMNVKQGKSLTTTRWVLRPMSWHRSM